MHTAHPVKVVFCCYVNNIAPVPAPGAPGRRFGRQSRKKPMISAVSGRPACGKICGLCAKLNPDGKLCQSVLSTDLYRAAKNTRRCKFVPHWVLRICIGVLFDEVFAAGACGHAPLRDADMGSAAAEEAAEAGGEFFEVVADLFQGGHGFVEGVHIQAFEGIGCLSKGGDGLVEALHIQV